MSAVYSCISGLPLLLILHLHQEKEEAVGKKSLLERKCVEKMPPFSVLLVFAVIFLVHTSSTQN